MNKELEDQFYITHRELDNSGNIHKAFNEMHKLMLMFILEIEKKESDMDKKINKLAKPLYKKDSIV